MQMKKWATGLVTFLLFSGYLFAEQKTVAVMNFTNYGGAGINYLSNALPESVSASLAELKEIKVVERRHLGNLLNEIALEQTGVIDTQGIDRIGKMAKADILILGSIAGDPENIILTLKAVDVETGKVVDAKIVKGHISKIFDLSSQAARAMGALISGQGVGRLSISTNPSGADVFVDGIQIGKTPIVEYQLTVGRHNLKATLNGYLDYDETLDVKNGVHERLSPMLAESKTRKMAEIGFGVSYLLPIGTPVDIKGAPYFYIFLGQSFNKLKIGVEIGYSSLVHDQAYTWFGVEKTQLRNYNLLMAHIFLTYAPFNGQYVSPYFGGFAGYTYLQDVRPNASKDKFLWFDAYEELYNKQMLGLGAVLGFTVMPYSRISVNIEGRFYVHPFEVTRSVYGQQGIGALQVVKTENFMFNAFTLGGSVKYNFEF